MASCAGLDDPDFDFARRFVDWEAGHAYDLALESLGGPSYLVNSKIELIPIGENDALKGEFYEVWARENSKLKLQKLFQAFSDDRHRKALFELELCHINAKISEVSSEQT